MGEPVRGAQLVARAATVLQAVAASSPQGCRTSEVTARTGLSRPTTHRLLISLSQVGYLDRDQGDGRWYLGPEIYVLGIVAAARFEVTARARSAVSALSRATGESAFYSIVRGEDVTCLLRNEGSFPLRSFVLREGSRFPLGVSSGGLALLSYRSDAFIDEYLERVDLIGEWGPQHGPDQVRRRIETTRKTGYAVNPGLLVDGSVGMAAAVFADDAEPVAAISITGVESRFSGSRQLELGRILLEVAHGLGKSG